MDTYDGIINKPEMKDLFVEHGLHKYIDKYLGKNGKWIYKYAGQAKSAANGLVNKAKTILPGLQSQAAGAVTTAKKKTASIASTGSNTVSSLKKKAKGAYYSGKSKVQEATTKQVRRKLKIKDPTIITEGAKKRVYPTITKYSINKAYSGNSGKSDSRSSQRGSRVTEGISEGRKRALNNILKKKKIENNRPRARKKNVVAGTGSVKKRR